VPHRSRHIVSAKKGDFDPGKFLATVGDGEETVATQGNNATKNSEESYDPSERLTTLPRREHGST